MDLSTPHFEGHLVCVFCVLFLPDGTNQYYALVSFLLVSHL